MFDDELLDRAALPDGRELRLIRWRDAAQAPHLAIAIGDLHDPEGPTRSLMSSHDRGSEVALGELVAARVADLVAPRVLIGGLGLGFTLRAALDALPAGARVTIAELLPAVVAWNRGEVGALADRPLDDPRVTLAVGDVGDVIDRTRASGDRFDAIVLDVDNGPDALVHPENAKLYKRAGLERARAALAGPGSVLAVWSAFPSKTFTRWMTEVGFEVAVQRIASTDPRGPRYYIWVGLRT